MFYLYEDTVDRKIIQLHYGDLSGEDQNYPLYLADKILRASSGEW